MRIRRQASRAYISRATRSDHGMTLIEIMVAAFILLVAMAGIVPFFLTGLSQASTLRFKSVASNVAREKMEEIRQLDYREIYTEANRVADPTLGTRSLESLFGTSATVRDASFAVSYQVDVAPYDEGYLKEVTVNVTWNAPPRVSAAKLTTLVHQQFLGPRGSLLVLDPTYADPRGTPFDLLSNVTSTNIKYYIAQADWGLVYDNLDTTPVAKEVYARLALFDENGQSIALGDSANGYKIDAATYLKYDRDAVTGQVSHVWYEYPYFDAASLPDGYWELRAVAYNVFDEPGNVWRLIVRVEKGLPAAPTDFVAAPQADNQTVVLSWTGGSERDRARYLLQRRLWDGADWLPWVAVASNLNPNLSTYTDQGDIGQAKDPWGNATTQHYYEYQLWAEDNSSPALAGPATAVTVVLPPLTTTTTVGSTSTTTPTSTTTTTVATQSDVQIKNTSSKSYNVIVQNSSGTQVYSGTVNKNTTVTVSGLPGDTYQITATSAGRPTITQSFSVPQQANTIVLTIV